MKTNHCVFWSVSVAAAFLACALALKIGNSGSSEASASVSGAHSAAIVQFHTAAGQLLSFPAGMPVDRAQQWDYSPDGTRLALLVPASISVWTIESNQVTELPAAPGDQTYSYALRGFYWVDSAQILAREERCSKAEAGAWLANHSNPIPTPSHRWVLLNAMNAQRVMEGPFDNLVVVGVKDAHTWYVKASDGKLRAYDSLTQTLGSEAYFDYNAGAGFAAQVCPGSDWFHALVPGSPQDPFHGRLDVFNIATGQKRSAEGVYRPIPAAALTSDGRYLFSTATAGDGLGEPRIDDLAGGVKLSLPPGERWLPWCISSTRGMLLVGVPKATGVSNDFTWDYAEVPLSYLTQL